jgi:hypothetical protein
LAQLVSRFDVLYDVAGTTVLSLTEKQQLLLDGYRALWSEVVGVNKTFRVKTTPTFALAGGIGGNTSALPPDFREVLYVRSDPDTDQERFLNKNGPRNGSQSGDRSYRVQDANLMIMPPQRSQGNYALDYVPQCPPIAGAPGFTVRLISDVPLPANNSFGGPGIGKQLIASALGALSVDGVAVAVNDRILVVSEANKINNGIYTVSNTGSGVAQYVLTRATDYDQFSEVAYGDIITASAGAQSGTSFMNVTPPAQIGIDGTPMLFAFVFFTVDAELDQFQDFIVWFAVVQGLIREESDATGFLFLLDGDGQTDFGERGRVKRWASDQRTADPDGVEDVRHRNVFSRGPW